MNCILRTTVVTLMAGFAASAMASHPYHVSLTEIHWNEKTASFEVAVCVWPADLEKALSVQEKKPIDLDKSVNLEDMMLRYVSRKFVCRNDETIQARIRWVGYETTNKQTWVYFEMKPPKIDDGDAGSIESKVWTLQNKMFFELNDDQLNQINFVARPGELATGICSAGKTDVLLQATPSKKRR